MFRLLRKDEPEWHAMSLFHDESYYRYHNHLDDNASGPLCPVEVCTDDSLPIKVLRWIKLVIETLAKSYYGLPIVLVLLPLSVGLIIGWMLGRQQGPRRPPASSGEPWLLRCLSQLGAWWNFLNDNHEHDSVVASSQPTCRPLRVTTTKQPDFARSDQVLGEREECTRAELRSDCETTRESGVDLEEIPRHIAIVMDGNRRYGKKVYGSATSGHWDGSRKVLQVAKWCIAEEIKVLTVYAFSTENWRRDPAEVASLMALFAKYCEELRVEAMERNICVRVLSTQVAPIPAHVKAGLDRLEHDTRHGTGLQMNVCLSYGSRGEMVGACQRIAKEVVEGRQSLDEIDEQTIHEALLTHGCPDPDVLVRTSGEMRLSNFLLWQLAYTELFFLDINWPEFEKDNLLDVIRTYAHGRRRRFGK